MSFDPSSFRDELKIPFSESSATAESSVPILASSTDTISSIVFSILVTSFVELSAALAIPIANRPMINIASSVEFLLIKIFPP